MGGVAGVASERAGGAASRGVTPSGAPHRGGYGGRSWGCERARRRRGEPGARGAAGYGPAEPPMVGGMGGVAGVASERAGGAAGRGVTPSGAPHRGGYGGRSWGCERARRRRGEPRGNAQRSPPSIRG